MKQSAAAVILILAVSLSTPGRAYTVYESATLGSPHTAGPTVYGGQWMGVRFTTLQTHHVVSLGAHLEEDDGVGAFFIAVFPIDGGTNVPPCTNLSCALSWSLISAPTPSAEVQAAVDFILPAGTWGLVVGSGLGGATGSGNAVDSNTDIGTPSYFGYWSGSWHASTGSNDMRFFLVGVPCGNGIVEGGEDCDATGVDSADCNADCTFAVCGDGHVNAAANEDCEEGGVDTLTCDADCTFAGCGDGYLNVTAGEDCDASGIDTASCDSDCTHPACGDDHVNALAGEECDDATDNSDTDPDACRTTCESASCGDGVIDTGEACDDATDNSDTDPDACRTTCESASCGDGAVDSGEECDDGNTTAGDGCDVNCLTETTTDPICGNGAVEGTEECDDGNTTAGDGCDASCHLETTDPVCGNGTVEGTEECDDGNTTAGDGCDASCLSEAPSDGDGDEGCGCQTPRDGSGAGHLLLLLLMAFVLRYRRRH